MTDATETETHEESTAKKKQLIDGKRSPLFLVDPETLTIIGVDTDDKQGEHPLWDERAFEPLAETMVLNIMALGVQEPVIVVVEGKDKDRKSLIVDGRRRCLHAREANRRLKALGEETLPVPVIAKKGMSEEDQSMVMVSLNEQRAEDSMMVKAAKAARMHSRGVSAAKLAIAFGVNVQSIELWIKINGLSNATKEMIAEKKISPTAAAAFAGMSAADQKTGITELLAESAATGEKPTVERAKQKVKAKRNEKNGTVVEVTGVAPKLRVLKKVIENGTGVLSDDFIRGLRVAIGDLNPNAIKGLQELMRK